MVKVGSSMLLLVCCALFVVPGAARETKVGSVCGAGEEIESPNCPGMLANDMVQRNALATIYLSCGCTGWKVKHADEATGRGSLFLTAGHCGNAEVLDGTYNYKTNCAGDGDGWDHAITFELTRLAREEEKDEYTLYELTGDCPHDANVEPILLDAAPPIEGQGMFLIGHPNRRPQLVSHQEVHDEGHHCEVRSLETGCGDSTRATYYCDTQGGNSGSPVFSSRTGHAWAIHTHGGCNDDLSSANSGGIIANIVDVLDEWSIPYIDSRTTDVTVDIAFVEQAQCAQFPDADSFQSVSTETQAECEHLCENALSCIGYEWGQGCKTFYSPDVVTFVDCVDEQMFVREGITLSGGVIPSDPTLVHVEISIETTDYGYENSWSLGEYCSGRGYLDDSSYEVTDCYMPAGTYDLTCVDSYGDGWHGGFITINGEEYCSEFEEGNSEVHSITIEGSGTTVDPSATKDPSATGNPDIIAVQMTVHVVDYAHEMEWTFGSCTSANADYAGAAIDPPTGGLHGGIFSILKYFGLYCDEPATYDMTCNLPAGAHLFTCIDTYGDGWHGGKMVIDGVEYCEDFTSGHRQNHCINVGGTKDSCNKGTVQPVDMVLHTQEWGSEMSWSLDYCTSSGPYEDHSEIIIDNCYLNEGEYILECQDSYGDGWHGGFISINGVDYCADFQTGSSYSETVITGGGATGAEDDELEMEQDEEAQEIDLVLQKAHNGVVPADTSASSDKPQTSAPFA